MKNDPHKLIKALLDNQEEMMTGTFKVTLQPYNHPEPANPEIMAAWRVLKQEPSADGIRVTLDDLVEDPDADPLVVFRWPEGVIPVAREQHLVLWRNNLWWCKQWRKLLGEDGVGSFSKFSLPLVKKAYPQLLASKLVGVQLMTQPAGLVYYIRYKYAQAKNTSPMVGGYAASAVWVDGQQVESDINDLSAGATGGCPGGHPACKGI